MITGLNTLAALIALAAASAPAQTARELVAASGVKGGLVVCLGRVDGIALEDLRVNDSHLVQGLLTNAEAVASERKRIQAKGKYGPVSVREWNGKELPYVDNLVNLIVVSGFRFQLSGEEISRVLAPNGVLMAKKDTGWTRSVQPWPAGMGEWTHWLCGPDNNAVCADDMPAFPRELQWQQAPLWLKSHELIPPFSAMVSARGRLFYILDDTARTAAGMGGMPETWVLIARDAFNGLQLWQRPITEWGTPYWMSKGKDGKPFEGQRTDQPDDARRRLVAADDRVYLTPGLTAPVVALDAATGDEVRRYPGTEKTSEILYRDGKLYLVVNHMLGTAEVKKQDISIMALDAESGNALWESKGHTGGPRMVGRVLSQHVNCALTLGDQQAFFLNDVGVVGLDLRTGKELWRYRHTEEQPRGCAIAYGSNTLFLSHRASRPKAKGKKKSKGHCGPAVLIALDVAIGKVRWSADSGTLACYGQVPDIFISQGLVWMLEEDATNLVGLDPATGARKKTIDATVIATGTHHNCYQNKASRNLMFYGRNKGVECFDFNMGKVEVNKWVKGACAYGIMPANGMLYAPSHMCGCKADSKLNGMVALTGVSLKGKPLSDASAVTQGPAFGKEVAAAIAGEGAWPIYRGGMERRGYQSVPLADGLKQQWVARPGGALTPPVIAGGRIFVAAKDAHTVFGIDAASGKAAWTHVAGGRIDSAPTWAAGRLVFGGRDGLVYCLDATSGELIWTFRAAPADIQITAFEQPESAWPVSGSVLVHDNKVYAPAGRSSMLDSGIALTMLDLKTGKPLKSCSLKGDANADLLIGNGERMCLRGVGLNMTTLDGKGRSASFLKAYGGFLDDSWFNVAFWEYDGVSGIMLAMDKNTIYGIDTYRVYGTKSDAKPKFYPGRQASMLFASAEKEVVGRKGGKRLRQTRVWGVPLPILAKSLVVVGDKVCVAGVRDVVDEKDPWAHLSGKMGAKLLVCSQADGKTKAEFDLASPPVFDGLASANGSLFVSCRDGSVVCFGK